MRFLAALVGTTVLALLTVSAAFPQARPDFSGTWTLDPAVAGAPAAGGRASAVNPPPQLTLTQDAGTLTMSWSQDGRKTTETFHLDGSESKTQAGSVMRATWEADKIVVVIAANLGGNVVEQRRVLSIDQGNLVIELPLPSPQGGDPTVVRVVYKKA